MADTNVELSQIGNYLVTRLLKESSTSRLYLGKQTRKKEACIRVLNTPFTNDEAKEAFLSRASQIKKFTHRNAVAVLEFGLTHDSATAEEVGYLAMQYVTGETFKQRFPTGQQLAPDEVKRLLTPIADALQYAHSKKLLHGNLHPGNLLTSSQKETLISDFALALSQDINPFEDVASAIPYMSPEQLRGEVTQASDQYALAVMVYEWLCGRRPYLANERATLLYQQEHEPLPLPSSLNSNISPSVESVLLKALAFKAEERFPAIHLFASNYLHALMGIPLNIEINRPSVTQVKPLRDNSNLNGHTPGINIMRETAGTEPFPGNVGVQFIAPSPPTTSLPTPIDVDDIDF